MDNLIYLIKDEASGRIAIIDPAWDVPAIDQLAQTLGGKVSDVLLTHSHHDHINGIDELLDRHDAELHLLRDETRIWDCGVLKATLHSGGDIIQLGKTEIRVLHTPGHSPGSACYHIGNDLITGDTLFVFGCGHCRLQQADPEALFNSLKKMREQLPLGTVIHPGHHYADAMTSTMEEQIQGNPFMHFSSLSAFKQYRLVDHGKTRSTPYSAIECDAIRKQYESD